MFCVLVVFVCTNVFSQATFKMSNGKVYLCKGKLTDSEGNTQAPKKYANNENYIFTVCVKGASTITIDFNGAFCTENISDFLKVYQGKDTSGTLLRTYSGTINNPISITSNDSCITFYFHSDANIVCEGWDLDWEAKITSIPQPKFSSIADPTCNSKTIRVNLDQKFNCDSVDASNFVLSGALSTAVSKVTAIGCDSKNETSTFDIEFANGLNRSGNYLLNFNSYFKDACDSIWLINAKLNFKITDCPIRVNLFSNRYTICKGSCAFLNSFVTGGNASNYAYTWLSGNITGATPKWVCPTVNTQYILQVSDGVSVDGRDTINIVVLDPPVAQNDTTICESSGAFNLTATPAGGKWFGNGITNGSDGTFNPGVSGAGIIKAYYFVGSCKDSVTITVKAINAGPPNAACPGSAPFTVSNFSPTGGTWSGPNINSAGLITPPNNSGSFIVTYSWNGCLSNKTINIDSLDIAHYDTICQSVALDTFEFYPIGGNWSGPGLVSNILGTNTPVTVGPGNHVYIYRINGCADTFRRTINAVDARWDEIACPDAGQRLLPTGIPAGGFWTGKGMLDSFSGIFDADSFSVPGKSTFAQATLTYHALNGCKDNKIMYIRYTRFYKDTVKNCVTDTAYFMRYQYLLNDPWNMTFTGSPGIVGTTLYSQKFSPSLAGRGSMNQIIGEANGCFDTLIIHVYPRANIQKDTVLCIADDPIKLFNGMGSGFFFGPGITNFSTGMFNPALAGPGLHLVKFSIPFKCIDTIRILVNPLPTVNFSGLQSNYCFRDTAIPIVLSPKGGVLTGNGIIDTTFNPSKAGTGSHTIKYTIGSGKCINSSSFLIDISDTLKLDLFSDKDSICPSTPVNLITTLEGGTGTYKINWNTGQSNVQNIYTIPKTTTHYRVVLTDGCSDSVKADHIIYVHPQMFSSVSTSNIQCYGQKGFANLIMQNPGNYSYQWNTNPVQTTPSITASVGTTYKVKVTDNNTGCLYDTSAYIPGYTKIRAYFTVSPAGQCIYSNNAFVQIINLSEGGTNGTWDFGDNTIIPYDVSNNPSHLYLGDTDAYEISLIIRNEGNCVDSFKVNICVLDTVTLFIPTGFTPNGDGNNDIFRVNSASISKINMQIFNRWGEMVYETDNPAEGWDGTFNGKQVQNGYFVYVIKYKGKSTAWKYMRGYFYLLR